MNLKKKRRRHFKNPMGRIYEKCADIVTSSSRCRQQALALLDTLTRFVKFHNSAFDHPPSASFLMTHIEQTRTSIEERLVLLSSVEEMTKKCADGIKHGYLASSDVSALQSATDELAHQFMILYHPLDSVLHEVRCELPKAPIKASGSLPGIETIQSRFNFFGRKATSISSALYEVSLELAELRIATHRDPNGADEAYVQRRRRLAEIKRYVKSVLRQ
ncbi:MAG: hypothetical protein K2Y22_14505 [Candidatus Obscuribacterales bacterium]|nr:hypothetical protein [Candidatus Obscuribacterales bacterium]